MISFLTVIILCFGWSVSCTHLRHFTLKMQIGGPSHISGIAVNVNNLKESISFYSNALGMDVYSQSSDCASLGYKSDGQSIALKLQSVGDKIKIGDSYGGIGIRSSQAKDMFSRALELGASSATQFGSYSYGASLIPDEDEMIPIPVSYGSILDPNGYSVELREGQCKSTLAKITLNVLDLDDATKFYSEVLKMDLLRRRSNIMNTPKSASMCSYLGYAGEEDGGYLELFYKYSVTKLNHGNGLGNISLASSSLIEDLKLDSQRGCVVGEDGSLSFRDLDGYKITVHRN